MTILDISVSCRKKIMERNILFPFRIEENNRKAFAFTIEFARKSNTDIIALTSLDLSQDQILNKDKLEKAIKNKKNEIFCNLLEMKGYYHGHFNQWNDFAEIKIHVRIILHDLNGAICSTINEHTDLDIILQEKYFSGIGLFEEISSNTINSNVSFIIIPRESEFIAPSTDFISVIFCKQKKLAFRKIFNETKIFDLPEDYDGFREEMIIQQTE